MNAAEIDARDSITASICPQDDQDWFKFGVAASQAITVTLTAESDPDQALRLELYSPTNKLLVSAKRDGNVLRIRNYQAPETGDYRLKAFLSDAAITATVPITYSLWTEVH